MTAVTAADASGGAGPSTAPASSPAGPSRPPAIDTASNVPPLHVILTTAPSAPVPAPLTRPRGLVNTGNMCFANVIMQGLLYTPHFYKLMTVIGRTVPANLGRRALMDATVDFLREFPLESSVSPPERPPTSGKSTPLTTDQLRQMSWQQDSFIPQGLYDAMMENKRFEHMRSGRQEDAEEFLGHFLDTLHEEMLAILTRLQANPPPASATWAANAGASALAPAGDDAREVERPLSPSETEGNGWLEVGKKNKVSQTRVTKARESAITSIFGGKLRSTLHTPGTGKDSVTLEPYQHLQLDIKPDYVTSIEEALKHLTEPETVQVHAPNRSGMVDAKKQMLIETLPPILIVHLKRFEYDMRGGVQKSSKPLLYKTTLEIPKEVLAPNQQGVPPPRYRLYGVVYHHGKYTTGGHYTADILRQNQSEWLRIDDTQIGVISESDVSLLSPDKQDADRTAYLLFYQRITDQPGSKSAPAANAQPQVKRPAAAVKGKGRV
ncbi:cysteine proteinase [Clavulina sp. PMI_390]|nr:cysteine proteinase [Clavulina sp. PMI_390]